MIDLLIGFMMFMIIAALALVINVTLWQHNPKDDWFGDWEDEEDQL